MGTLALIRCFNSCGTFSGFQQKLNRVRFKSDKLKTKNYEERKLLQTHEWFYIHHRCRLMFLRSVSLGFVIVVALLPTSSIHLAL